MKTLGNIVWLIFGGFECAIGYFGGALALSITIIGIPFGLQLFKIGLLCLWPFGSKTEIEDDYSPILRTAMNVVWFIFGGELVVLGHLFFALLFFITIIGIPFAKQHFKMAKLALAPFGRDIVTDL